jgi:bacterioferritin
MEHVDGFAARILSLDGFPNMQTLDPLRVGRTVEEIIDALYLEAAAYCKQINDGAR